MLSVPIGDEIRYFSTKKLIVGLLDGHVWPTADSLLLRAGLRYLSFVQHWLE